MRIPGPGMLSNTDGKRSAWDLNPGHAAATSVPRRLSPCCLLYVKDKHRQRCAPGLSRLLPGWVEAGSTVMTTNLPDRCHHPLAVGKWGSA